MSMRLDRLVIFHQSRTDEKPRKLFGQNRIILIRRRRVGNHDSLTTGKSAEISAYGSAQATFDFVAHHRFTDFVGNGKTHPYRPRGREYQNDVRFDQTLTVAVNVRIRTVFIQPVRFIKQLFAERCGREILSALVATVFKHASAALRLHSLTKAVHFALLAFFGLISSFHDNLRNTRISPR